jgi:hypothetical protein
MIVFSEFVGIVQAGDAAVAFSGTIGVAGFLHDDFLLTGALLGLTCDVIHCLCDIVSSTPRTSRARPQPVTARPTAVVRANGIHVYPH